MHAMESDMWATSLPCDLLLDIFRRLGSTALIRCAAVCRPWRRAIIDNAARCLRPRPDCFLPDLLLAFLDYYCNLRQHTTTLDERPENVPSAEMTNMLAAMDTFVDEGHNEIPLASRDGFLLFRVCDKKTYIRDRLCLRNLLAGSCRFLSLPVVGKFHSQCSYVLITSYDDDDAVGAGSSAVRILAVKAEKNCCVTYQIFSSTSGVWGPVKRTAKLIEEDEDDVRVHVLTKPMHAVVCARGGGSVVYWLVDMLMLLDEDEHGDDRTFLFAMDTRTERTWTTELPEEYNNMDDPWNRLMLATAEDGRQLSLVVSRPVVRPLIEVWVLADGGDNSQWTRQRTMDLESWWRAMGMQSWLLPYWPYEGNISLSGFCPRSGCLFAIATNKMGSRKQFLIGVDGSSPRLIETADDGFMYMIQYEMDWSTYISKMKYV